MSTENEGAAVTPPARSSAPDQPGTSGDDFALAEPRGAERSAADDTAVLDRVPEPAKAPEPAAPAPAPAPVAAPVPVAGGGSAPPVPPVPAAPPSGAGAPAVPAGEPTPGPYAYGAQAQSGGGAGWGAPAGGQGGMPPQGPGGGMGGPGGPGAPGMGTPGGGGPHNPWAAPPMSPPPGGPKRRSGRLVAAAAALAVVAGGVGGGVGYLAADRNDTGGSTTVSAEAGRQALNRSPESVAGIADKALPSVVTIESGGGGEEGTGTGFVYDKQGHILTNNHVVANAANGGKLTATFSDGKSYTANIVGRASGYDIAVLKLEGAGDRPLAPLPLGNSDQMAVGDATIAIGAPFGLSGTVTTGIISAKNRPVASSDGQGSDASYMNALQTDASINPGNSGGPLLNAQGAVVGVNSAIQSGGGGGMGQSQPGSVGLGFAIPVNQAKRVAAQLIDTGTPVYPVIGVRVNMDQQGGEGGARVADNAGAGAGEEPVEPNGPADEAGLQPGDVITEFDGSPIDSGPTLIARIWTKEPGETVKITYQRDGESKTTDITLGSRKGDDS